MATQSVWLSANRTAVLTHTSGQATIGVQHTPPLFNGKGKPWVHAEDVMVDGLATEYGGFADPENPIPLYPLTDDEYQRLSMAVHAFRVSVGLNTAADSAAHMPYVHKPRRIVA